MATELNYSRFQKGLGARFVSALMLGSAWVITGCASSGGTAAGTYHPSAATTGKGASWPGEPGGVHINVSLAERKLYLKDGNSVVQAYTIGVGKEGYETPTGDYTVRRIVWNPPWTPPNEAWAADKEPQEPGSPDNPMKVVKIYFNEPDYYIHGTGTVSSLGGAVSHGCLRMAPSDAAALGRYLMDHGGAAHDASWFQHVQSSNETETVTLPSGIPMHVAQ